MGVVRFMLDGEVQSLVDPNPTGSVLDLLRYRLRRTGAKEGCAEGDCGACTVLVGTLDGDGMVWRAVNACILFVPMLDGKAVLTVESVGNEQSLHPLQQAFVETHASQCGFCTPGFVMSLYGRSIGACGTREAAMADVVAGNLCRCTGYGPILQAAARTPIAVRDDTSTIAALRSIARQEMLSIEHDDLLSGTRRRWFAPRTIDDLAALLVTHPHARIVAGATDVGLWVTKQHRVIDDVVAIGEIAEMATIVEGEDGLTIGAAVRYVDAHDALARLHPALWELVRRIGGLQVRNAGTIGGNIANGSPIGDMPPALIALGATLTLRRGDMRRTLPLEDYFLAYGQQDRAEGEFVERVFVPRPAKDMLIRITKLSKRFDSDISAVCAAFALTIADGMVTAARIAFGGMAGTPKRASACEAALIGRQWNEATAAAGIAALEQDFTPRDDVRGSARYRLTVAGNLLRRLWIEGDHPGEAVSVLDERLADG